MKVLLGTKQLSRMQQTFLRWTEATSLSVKFATDSLALSILLMASSACLAYGTVCKATTKDGFVRCCKIEKKGPESINPIKLMEMIATHPAVCQVGDGELKGKDLKQQLMGASILENPHANLHNNPKSVWQKA